MPDVNWRVSLQVSGGTTMTVVAESQSAEATDTVEVVLEPKTDKVVDIQPGGVADIRLLVIKSSVYGPVTYKANEGIDDSEDSIPVTLDAPHVFSGGSVVLFGRAPRQLKLSNTSPDKKATVVVFVARDATPESP